MPEISLRLSTLGLLLAFVNLVGCAAFLISRPPIDKEYLQKLDESKRQGAFSLNTAVAGIVACRIVSPWGEWHGHEVWYVKAMEVANLDIIIPLLILSVFLDTAFFIPTCFQSWIIGVMFAICAATQWYFIGRMIQRKLTHARY